MPDSARNSTGYQRADAGAPELAADPRFATGADRVRHRAATVAAVAKILLTRTREEWLRLLEASDIPCSPVHTLGELAQHPHTQASDMILRYRNDAGRELNGVAAPLRVDGERSPLRSSPPRLGQDSEAILAELGYSKENVSKMIKRGIVVSG